jgi:hypothetical protein
MRIDAILLNASLVALDRRKHLAGDTLLIHLTHPARRFTSVTRMGTTRAA